VVPWVAGDVAEDDPADDSRLAIRLCRLVVGEVVELVAALAGVAPVAEPVLSLDDSE